MALIFNKEKSESGLIKNREARRTKVRGFAGRIIIFIVSISIGGALQKSLGYSPGVTEGQIYLLLPALFGLLLALAIKRMDEWERAIVLRFGKFYQVKGPGLFLIIPLIDRIAKTVDLRIRVSDFSAETTLTRDSVTVTVDALCFWLVWDAEKAVCEVQNYEEAVVLSAKTALRSAVSSHDLSVFLHDNKRIEEFIRGNVDKKTTEWGITVQHIEITDVQIPEHLQDSMSRMAQAEREKQGRILLAEAEIQVATIFENAASIYDRNATALTLKNLSILNEGLKAGNSMMLVPNSITEKLEGQDLFGLKALGEIHAVKNQQKKNQQKKNQQKKNEEATFPSEDEKGGEK